MKAKIIHNLTADYHCPVCKRSIRIDFPYSGMNFTAMLRMLNNRDCSCGNPYKVRYASYDIKS